MDSVESAILRTVLYADVFDFPLTIHEIHHFLIAAEPLPISQIEHTLAQSACLRQLLVEQQGYIVCSGRETIISRRLEREEAARHLWPQALLYGRWLARLPFVRMVALTGALAMRNAHQGDDFDYMLVTSPGRVWLARLFAVVIVRLVKLRGGVICPNYVVAEDALEQRRRDLFIAHEIVQMVPLYGLDLYHQLRCLNLWADRHLPNASAAFYQESEQALGWGWRGFKQAAEVVLSGRVGDMMEHWEHRRKLRRFRSDLHTPYSDARLDHTQVKGHFNDHGHYVMKHYESRLQHYGLSEQPAPGD
ncbi:MAG: hypothetical protein SF029_19000 [bacterium]|nr:hypothetical protein [bacterium]